MYIVKTNIIFTVIFQCMLTEVSEVHLNISRINNRVFLVLLCQLMGRGGQNLEDGSVVLV